jgi:signal transduction histidine kinase
VAYSNHVMIAQGVPVSPAGNAKRRLQAELEELRAALELEVAERQRLERTILDLTDNERNRLAKMLHDTLCQSLSGISILTRVVQHRLEESAREEAGEVAELGIMIAEANRELHSVVRLLQPVGSEEPDLGAALADLAPTLFQGIPCEIQCPAPVVLRDPFAAGQLIRIAHQAVADALRRPGIQRIVIALSAPNERVTLTIRDDGRHSAAEPTADYLAGLEMLRLRAAAIGAKLTISSETNQGTLVTCMLPLLN